MSKHNKANKSNYVQAGRLTPDEMARERQKQMRPKPPVNEKGAERITGRARESSGSRPRRSGREE